MTKFEVGKSYATRSICDYDCIHSFEILARTEKTVTVKVHGAIVRRGLRMSTAGECFSPFGRYSMSATIFANEHALRLAGSEIDTHGSPELDADAAKLRALGADPGPTCRIMR